MSEQKPNGTLEQIKQLNWPTVILILFSGGANFLLTGNKGSQLSYEQQEAITKIRELHRGLDDFEERQKQALRHLEVILKTDSEIVADTHEIVKQLNDMRRLDQQRGMPQ